MRRSHLLGPAALVAVLVAGAACSSSPARAGNTAAAGSASAPLTPPAGATGETSQPNPPHTTPAGCATGQVHLSWTAGQPAPAPICLHVGAQLSINLYPPDLHQWTTPVSSDPPILRIVAAAANQEGAMSVTAEAQTPGHAVLGSVAHALDGAPDPHDLPWQITITVVT